MVTDDEAFKAFLDESEDATTGFYVVGGFVWRKECWQAIETAWSERLPSGISSFHATDCFTGNNEFEGMSLEARAALLDSLVDLLACSELKLIGYGVDAITLKTFSPRRLENEFLGNKYAAPLSGVVQVACEAMGNLPGPCDWDVLIEGDHWEQCAFFIEKNQYSASAQRVIEGMRCSRDLWYRNRIGRISFGSKRGDEGMPLLQIADLGAFLAAKYISKAPNGRIPWTPYVERLRAAQRVSRMVLADKHSLEKLYQTHEELKREAAEGRSIWDDI